MSDWTTIIRGALATLIGALSLAASLCVDSDETAAKPAEPITATVSDQPARVQVSDEPADASSSGDPCPAFKVQAQVSDAIEDARRSQGSMLEGTALQGSGPPVADIDEFSSALQRVARESEIAPAGPLPLGAFSPDLAPAAEVTGSVLLRQAARELETRAADNEDLRQFEEADQLRRLSSRLRREARRWDERSQLTGSAP